MTSRVRPDMTDFALQPMRRRALARDATYVILIVMALALLRLLPPLGL